MISISERDRSLSVSSFDCGNPYIVGGWLPSERETMVVDDNHHETIDVESTATEGLGKEDEATNTWKSTKELLILHLSKKLLHGDLDFRIEAAREIRRLLRKSPVKSSARSKLADAGVIPPLVPMLISSNLDARHASLLALLNLAVRNER